MATKSTWEAIIRRWRKTSTTDLGGGLERYRMHRNKKAQVREILPALLPENNQTLGKNMSICTKNIPRRIGDRALNEILLLKRTDHGPAGTKPPY